MRPSTFVAAVLLGTGLLAGEAHSSPYPQANVYFGVRDRATLADGFTADEIQHQPEKFAGKLLEVRGPVRAVAGSDDLTTILIGGEATTAATTVMLPVGKSIKKDFPLLTVGANIRALCRVVTQEGTLTGSLELVTAVKEYEAASVDSERAKKALAAKQAEERRAALAKRQQEEHQRQLASRSGAAAAHAVQGVKWTRPQILEAYARAVRHFNRRLTDAQARRIASTIIEYSLRYGLDARLVMAVVAVESNFNQHAVSRAGAQGLGQLMPGTAAGLGVGDVWDIRQNLEGSTRLLRNHIRNMGADGKPTDRAIKLALACYNAGAGAVKKYRGIPPYRETQNYVKKVTRLYRQMCGLE